MKDYLKHTFSSDDVELVSIIDELPLWSAPFGLRSPHLTLKSENSDLWRSESAKMGWKESGEGRRQRLGIWRVYYQLGNRTTQG